MSMQDQVSDLLLRIRNALGRKKQVVSVNATRMNHSILNILQNEGFIDSFEKDKEDSRYLQVKLKYFNSKPVIEKLTRVSKPGLRVYKEVAELPKILGGLGVAVISTSKGLLSDRQARALNVGGEVLLYVY